MSNVWEYIDRKKKGKLAKCWMAATLSRKTFHRKFKSSIIKEINISEMCDVIRNLIDTSDTDTSQKCNLNLSSQLVYGAIKILSYQTSILDKELDEIEKTFSETKMIDKGSEQTCYKDHLTVASPHSAQLEEDLHLLPDEFDIHSRFKHRMDAATGLDFGALTEEEMAFFESNDRDISSAFEKMRISHENLAITYEETELRVPSARTPQKRKSSEERHTETPSKTRRLRFEEAADQNQDVVTVPMPETEVFSVSATDGAFESIDDENFSQMKRKWSKKRVFADKNKKCSDATTKKWLSNVNAWTVPLNVIDANISKAEVLFTTPSTSRKSTCTKKWNNSLQELFSMHTKGSIENITKEDGRKEDELLIEESIEVPRSKGRIEPIKSTQQLPELSSVFEKSAFAVESSTQLRSFQEMDVIESVSSLTVQKKEGEEKLLSQEANIKELEEYLESFHIERRSVNIDLESQGEDKERSQKPVVVVPSPPIPITKQDLHALVEVKWRDAEMVEFHDVIPPNAYSKADAIECFLLLLELHEEKKITLEQAVPDVLWIKQYSNDG